MVEEKKAEQVPQTNKDMELVQIINKYTVKMQALNILFQEGLETAQLMLNASMSLLNEKNQKIKELNEKLAKFESAEKKEEKKDKVK